MFWILYWKFFSAQFFTENPLHHHFGHPVHDADVPPSHPSASTQNSSHHLVLHLHYILWVSVHMLMVHPVRFFLGV